jgi:uncharacterized protein YhbP (UPF0306 family)
LVTEPQAALNACVRDYLDRHNVLCLATCEAQQPWVAPVFYAVWQSSLIFLSAPHTRHCQNLQANPLASGSIQQDYTDWQAIKGIQLEGRVEPVDSLHKQSVIDCYSSKFPVTGPDAPVEITKALDKVSWFRLIPELMYFIDNSKGFGHRDTIDLSLLFD